jgi:hypothetical protein
MLLIIPYIWLVFVMAQCILVYIVCSGMVYNSNIIYFKNTRYFFFLKKRRSYWLRMEYP